MPAKRETLLCRYRYDPLDRVADCAPLNRESIRRFYRQRRLATEIQGPVQHSVFQHDEQLLAQQRREAGSVDSTLLATDLQRSVLYAVATGQRQQAAYSPYGHRSPEGGLINLLGFNGERPDPVTGHYLLGNGYRAFNPVLMRFNSPDSLSPFGKGGLNAYAYCVGDPINRVDRTGRFAVALITGMTGGALARRAFNVVEAAISAPLAAASKVGRGFRTVGSEAINSVNSLRPSYRAAKAAARYNKANTERLASIEELNRLEGYASSVEKYVSRTSAKLKEFGDPAKLSGKNLELYNSAEADSYMATKSFRKLEDYYPQALENAKYRVSRAMSNWRQEIGPAPDFDRLHQLNKVARRQN